MQHDPPVAFAVAIETPLRRNRTRDRRRRRQMPVLSRDSSAQPAPNGAGDDQPGCGTPSALIKPDSCDTWPKMAT
jgi:hypothetical protein